MNTQRILTGLTSLLIANVLTGCTNMEVIPKAVQPEVPAPRVYAQLTPSTDVLDCVNREYFDAKAEKPRLVVGEIRNLVTKQLGDITLPDDLHPFVNNSLSRLKSLFDPQDAQPGTPIQIQNLAPPGMTGGIQDNYWGVIYDNLKPDLSFAGKLYWAQVTRTAISENELVHLGISSQAKAVDFGIQLHLNKFDHNGNREFVAGPITLSGRVFAAEQGMSAFILNGDKFARGLIRFAEKEPARYALHYLFDTAVAALTAEYFSALRGKSPTLCKIPVRWSETGYLHDTYPNKQLPFSLTVTRRKGDFLCVSGKGSHQNNSRVRLKWMQYRKGGIQIEPTLAGHVDLRTLLDPDELTCLHRSRFHAVTDSLEVRVEDENHQKILGSQPFDLR